MSCGPGEDPSIHRSGEVRSVHLRLIDQKAFTETRISSARRPGERLSLDLSKQDDVQRLKLIAMRHDLTDSGLSAQPVSNDPIIAIEEMSLAYNRFTILMRSEADGFLEAFWARGGEEFGPDRKLRVRVRRSRDLREYVADWSKELPPSSSGYRFRIDPIDGQVPFEIRSIVLERIRYSAPRAEGPELLVGKTSIDQEVRSVIVVPGDREFERELSVPKDARLVFGLAAARDNKEEGTFTLLFLPEDGGAPLTLFEHRLDPPEDHEWLDFSLSLEPIEGRRGRLRADLRTMAAGDATFWANPVVTTAGSSRLPPPNVILVSLDTLGARHLTTYGASGVDDPFLTSLAGEGVVFESATSASSLTHVSHGSLLTGLSPLDGSMFWIGGSRLRDTTLAQILRESGYRTAAFTAGVLVTESLGFDRGFETFHQEDTLFKPFLERVDIEQVLDRGTDWLRLQDGAEPFFLFLHSYEVHGPYYDRDGPAPSKPKPSLEDYLNLSHVRGRNPIPISEAGAWVKRLDESLHEQEMVDTTEDEVLLETVRRFYRSEISFTDGVLARFFEDLRSRGLLENTIVVITADHGEAFFEHGLVEHGLLYEENLRVPLLLVGPRLATGKRVSTPVTTTDLVPTVLDLVGAEARQTMTGRSFARALTGERIPTTPFLSFVPGNGFAWYDGKGRKLIWRRALFQENFGRDELFDLRNDPSESHNLIASDATGGRELRAAARETLRRLPGIYVSLGGLEPGTYDLELDDVIGGRDRVYAFNVDPAGNGSADGESHWRGDVALRENSVLLFLNQGPEGSVSLTLRPAGGGGLFRYHVTHANVQERRTELDGARGSEPRLVTWRIPGGEPNAERAGGLSDEERDKLKNLGYIQ